MALQPGDDLGERATRLTDSLALGHTLRVTRYPPPPGCLDAEWFAWVTVSLVSPYTALHVTLRLHPAR
jgi:hypothetical protein